MRDSGDVVVCTCVKRRLNAQEAHSHSLARKGIPQLQLQNEGAAKKMTSRETVG